MTLLPSYRILILLAVLTGMSACQPKTGSTGTAEAEEAAEASEPQEPPKYFESVSFSDEFSFSVEATANDGENTLKIDQTGHPEGETFTHTINGKVYNAEAADLNSDGFPEILVFISSTGGANYGSLIAYSSNKGKSLSQAFIDDIAEDGDAGVGYMGNDAFAITDGKLTRRFPIYSGSGEEAQPTGFNRQVTYKLVDGEAARKFVVEKVIKYKAG